MNSFKPDRIKTAVIVSIAIAMLNCSPSVTTRYQPKFHVVVDDKELIPEGIAIHPVTGVMYLSSLHKKKIVEVGVDGNTKDLISEGAEGFLWGLGMKFSRDGKKLWACTAGSGRQNGETYLFEIDMATRTIAGKYTHDSANFFNDLSIHEDGLIYITDTERGAIFRFDPATKKLEEWLRAEELGYANGIAIPPHDDFIFVASGNRGLKKIDIATKQITRMHSDSPDYAIDGLQSYKHSLIGVIGWPQDKPETHRIIHYHLDKDQMIVKRDTLAIGSPLLNCPTTITWRNGNLFVLAKTNLGAYNRARHNITKAAPNLENPLIVILSQSSVSR